MITFPQQKVFDLARDCGIGATDANFMAGISNSSSNGACLRLGLLPPGARRDIEQKKIRDTIVERFIREASIQSWYPAWRDWLLSNKVHKVDSSRLPSYSGNPGSVEAPVSHGSEPPCYQPTPDDAERILEGMDPDNNGVTQDELRDEIEKNAQASERTLCPDWWENLKAANGSQEDNG